MALRRLQGAKKGKVPRQRWHSRQCGLCNLQNLKDARETELLSLRQHTKLHRYNNLWDKLLLPSERFSSLCRNSFVNKRERNGVRPETGRGGHERIRA
jgi:hypothetical protein